MTPSWLWTLDESTGVARWKSVFDSDASDGQEIYSRDRFCIWFRRQSLKSYESHVFALYTLSRPNERRYAHATRSPKPLWERLPPGYPSPIPCGNLGLQSCKAGPLIYTYFTAVPARTNPMMRATIGAELDDAATVDAAVAAAPCDRQSFADALAEGTDVK